MRVAKYYNNRDVRIEEIQRPSIEPEELLVKVMASGICGSDVLEWYRLKKAPLVLGHEIAGEIVEIGSKVSGFDFGDRVFVSHHVPCNTCRYCQRGDHTVCETLHSTNIDPGGFSEYIRVPEINVRHGTFKLPDRLSFDDGVFIEPLACAIRGQNRAGFKSGQSVLILGTGVAGILHLICAKANGATWVGMTDLTEYRLNLSAEYGADFVLDGREDVAAEVKRVNNNGVDLVIVCTGAISAFQQALEAVDDGGTILYYAPTTPGETFPLDVLEFWNKQVTITSTYANSPQDAREAIEMIKNKRVNVVPLITHRLGLAETAHGFKQVAEAGESMKVVIYPHQ